MGRPTLLDDLRAKKIVDAVAEGGSRTAAAEAARIHRATLLDWLARGRRGEAPYADFLDRVKSAEAEAELAMVRIVRTAAKDGTWQAAAWWLERRKPKLYSLRRLDKIDELAPKAKQLEEMPREQLLAHVRDQRAKLEEIEATIAHEVDEAVSRETATNGDARKRTKG